MGGFFGVVSTHDAISDVFFGTDYHSHLGPRRGGMAAYDAEIGLQRDIHNIENSPFRTKFDHIFEEMKGNSAIGCISDSDPQPLLMRSSMGVYAISFVGRINNAEELIEKYLLKNGGHFNAMTGGKINSVELVSALISWAIAMWIPARSIAPLPIFWIFWASAPRILMVSPATSMS